MDITSKKISADLPKTLDPAALHCAPSLAQPAKHLSKKSSIVSYFWNEKSSLNFRVFLNRRKWCAICEKTYLFSWNKQPFLWRGQYSESCLPAGNDNDRENYYWRSNYDYTCKIFVFVESALTTSFMKIYIFPSRSPLGHSQWSIRTVMWNSAAYVQLFPERRCAHCSPAVGCQVCNDHSN